MSALVCATCGGYLLELITVLFPGKLTLITIVCAVWVTTEDQFKWLYEGATGSVNGGFPVHAIAILTTA
jgi:hypothetical protein